MGLLPRLLEGRATFAIHAYQGKSDLLKKLEGRLRGYAKWLPQESRVLVLVDRDDDDCAALKHSLDEFAETAGLAARKGGSNWRVANRIAIEELEAWFFGEWTAMRSVYPRLKSNTIAKEAYRNCDKILGGTWEALERVLKNHGYFTGGLRKVELATVVGEHFDPTQCTSPSYAKFHGALIEAISPTPALGID